MVARIKTVAFRGFEAHTVEALRELREEKDAQLREKDKQIADLTARLARMEALVAKLAAGQNGG